MSNTIYYLIFLGNSKNEINWNESNTSGVDRVNSDELLLNQPCVSESVESKVLIVDKDGIICFDSII